MPFLRSEVCYNARVKYYPNSNKPCEIIVADESIFNPHGVELAVDKNTLVGIDALSDDVADETTTSSDSSYRSFSRARRRAYDLIRCNPSLNGFITLTFDQKEIDRTSYEAIIKALSVWLDNRVRRHGLEYILCPEYHKDGEGIHFHGLMNIEALKLVDSGHKRNGKKVYNISDFPFGFTTVLRVTGENSVEKCAGYIFKYMSKQCMQKIGGRYYLSGGDLDTPHYEFFNVDATIFDQIAASPLRGGGGGVRVAYGKDIEFLTLSGKLIEAGICEANLSTQTPSKS